MTVAPRWRRSRTGYRHIGTASESLSGELIPRPGERDNEQWPLSRPERHGEVLRGRVRNLTQTRPLDIAACESNLHRLGRFGEREHQPVFTEGADSEDRVYRRLEPRRRPRLHLSKSLDDDEVSAQWHDLDCPVGFHSDSLADRRRAFSGRGESNWKSRAVTVAPRRRRRRTSYRHVCPPRSGDATGQTALKSRVKAWLVSSGPITAGANGAREPSDLTASRVTLLRSPSEYGSWIMTSAESVP